MDLEEPFPMFYVVFYVFCLLCGVLLTLFAINVAASMGTYHPNLRRLYICVLLMWIPLCISKMCIFILQIRYGKVENNTGPKDGGYNFKIVSQCLRYFYFFYASATTLAVAVERTFATVHLASYEKSKNETVFNIITFCNVISAIFFTNRTVFHELCALCVVGVIGFYNFICFLLIIILYQYNLRRIQQLDAYHRDTKYTLSMRFQLRENIGILRLIMKLIYAVILFVAIIMGGLVVPGLLNFAEYTQVPIQYLVDFSLHNNPFIIIPMTYFFIPEFKKGSKAVIDKIFHNSQSKVTIPQPGYKVDPNETNIYFDQFNKALDAMILPEKQKKKRRS